MLLYLDYSDILDPDDPDVDLIKSLITTDRLFHVMAIAISESQLSSMEFENVIKTVLLYSDLKGLDVENSADMIYNYIHRKLFQYGGIRVSLDVMANIKDISTYQFKVIHGVKGVYFAFKSN